MAHAWRSATAAQIAEAIMEDERENDFERFFRFIRNLSDFEQEVEEQEPAQGVWKKLRGMEFDARHFPFSAVPGAKGVNHNSVYSLFFIVLSSTRSFV